MNTRTPITLASLAMAGLVISTLAQAVEPPPPPPPPQNSVQPTAQERGKRHADRARRREENLVALHAALKLKPEQETGWMTWSAAFQDDGQRWQEKHRAFAAWSKLPALERMEKKLSFARERVQKLEQRLAATKAFYETLSTGQRQVFDTQFNPWPGHEGTGKLSPPEESE